MRIFDGILSRFLKIKLVLMIKYDSDYFLVGRRGMIFRQAKM
jgi:hypothetical protein